MLISAVFTKKAINITNMDLVIDVNSVDPMSSINLLTEFLTSTVNSMIIIHSI